MTAAMCSKCGQATAGDATSLCDACIVENNVAAIATYGNDPPLAVGAVMASLEGIKNSALIPSVDLFSDWFSLSVIEQMNRRPTATEGRNRLGFTPFDLTVTTPDGTTCHGTALGGGGGASRVSIRHRFQPTLPAGTDQFTVSSRGEMPAAHADANGIEWRTTTRVDTTEHLRLPRPEGSCQYCGDPQGRDGLFCDLCRDVVFPVGTAFDGSPPLPTACAPLALHAGDVLGGDLTFLSIVAWNNTWVLRYRFGAVTATEVPMMGRWTATEDKGTVHHGFGNAMGGGPGGVFGDICFAPALRPDATTLNMVLHQHGDMPLLETTLTI